MSALEPRYKYKITAKGRVVNPSAPTAGGARTTPGGERTPWRPVPFRRILEGMRNPEIAPETVPDSVRETVPGPVRWAAAAWATAVACGVAESAVALAGMVAAGEGVPWPGLALRLAVYTSAALVVVWFARGHRWARAALVVGLGVVGGLGTLIAPVALAVLEGDGVLDAMGHASHGPLYLALRTAHIASVATAVVLTFAPSSNRFFARASGRPESASA